MLYTLAVAPPSCIRFIIWFVGDPPQKKACHCSGKGATRLHLPERGATPNTHLKSFLEEEIPFEVASTMKMEIPQKKREKNTLERYILPNHLQKLSGYHLFAIYPSIPI